MARNNNEYNTGDAVVSKVHGKGVVETVAFVEKPSDGDSTMYVVRLEDGTTRNLKAADLKAGKSAD